MIVSYNTAELTLAAIRSVYEQTRLSFELFVVDNNSSDGSADLIAERFPGVRLIRLDYNAGFAAANNLATKEASGRYVLLLNPDTVVLDGAVDTLVGFADEHPEYGVYGGSTFFGDGSRNPTAGGNAPSAWSLFCAASGLMSIFRGSRVFDPESLAWWGWDAPREVGVVTGCFMLVERDFWNSLGGFDERFHMYAEDADLSFRAGAAGRPCVLVPEAAIVHYGGQADGVRADKMVRLLTARILLFRKHWGPLSSGYAVGMMKMWVLTRSWYSSLRARLRPTQTVDSWSAVWRRRAEWTHVGAV